MPEPLKIQLPPQFRSFQLDRAAVNETDRSVPLSFSSEAPVPRTLPKTWPDKAIAGKAVREVLSHDNNACDLSRLRALCVQHDLDRQVGVVTEARIEDRRGVAMARFSQRPEGRQEMQDVIDGIRADVSVGYKILAYRVEPGASKDDAPTLRVTRWQPYEVSLVTIGADGSVGIGRAVDTEELAECEATRSADFQEEKTTITVMPEVITPDANQVRSDLRKEELKRQSEIRAAGKAFERHPKMSALVTRALEDGTDALEFKREAFELIAGDSAKPIEGSPTVNLGLDRKEMKRYSLVRALRCFSERKPLDGLELECSRAMEQLSGKQTTGFFIPNDIAFAGRSDMEGHRDMTAGSAPGGGNLIQTDVMGGSMIEYLRNKMVVRRLGARSLDGLTNNCAIPKQTGVAVGYSVAEQGAATESTQAIGQLALTPHHISAFSDFSVQLLAQSSVDVENFVRQDLMIALAQKTDALALTGTGSANQPTGVLYTGSTGTVAFGAAATWAKMIDFETQVANANADIGSLAYLTTPNVRAKLKAATKIATSQYSDFIWERGDKLGTGDGIINGYVAVATLQVPSDLVIFGNWNDLIIAGWAGLEVINDPYTGATTGTIRIIVRQMIDIGVRHGASFTVSSDSGAQ